MKELDDWLVWNKKRRDIKDNSRAVDTSQTLWFLEQLNYRPFWQGFISASEGNKPQSLVYHNSNGNASTLKPQNGILSFQPCLSKLKLSLVFEGPIDVMHLTYSTSHALMYFKFQQRFRLRIYSPLTFPAPSEDCSVFFPIRHSSNST